MPFTGHAEGMDHEHHRHPHRPALGHRVAHAIRPHSHDHGTDAALESSADGWRTLWISLAVLAVTAGAQAVVVVLTGRGCRSRCTAANAATAADAAITVTMAMPARSSARP